MDSFTPQRRRSHHSDAMNRRRKRRITVGGVIIIIIVTVVGSCASYFWLQNEQQKVDAASAAVQSRTDEIEAEYQQLVARVTADTKYREYALEASNNSIAFGTLPEASTIKLLSGHRDPSQLDVVVDKQHPIYPLDFVPETTLVYCNGSPATLTPETASDFSALCEAAVDAGLNLRVTSSYRSYQDQMATYADWVATYGAAAAETHSARPGYSEHQTGTTIDFGVANGPALDNFCGTQEQLWLVENAPTYGFIQRYTVENQQITGFSAECWHYRYVGTDVAAEYISSKARSLEDFWGMRGGSYTEVYRG